MQRLIPIAAVLGLFSCDAYGQTSETVLATLSCRAERFPGSGEFEEFSLTIDTAQRLVGVLARGETNFSFFRIIRIEAHEIIAGKASVEVVIDRMTLKVAMTGPGVGVAPAICEKATLVPLPKPKL